METTTLGDVLAFISTASSIERDIIAHELKTGSQSRQTQAAATLSKINEGDIVEFPYNGVTYTAKVQTINQVTAKVTILKMSGPPTRKGIVVGASIRVGASILARQA